jgi:NTE family protein
MRRIGLVLGAGGLTGQAFHAGVLAALAQGSGWDPRAAAVIVGTSAGSGVGAYLRLGMSAGDYAAMLGHGPMTEAGAALVERLGPAGDWQTPTLPRRWPQAPGLPLLTRLLTRPHRVRPESVLGVTVPPGRIDTETWAASLRALTGDEWPPDPLWICAVRTRDARRVVFGRDAAPRPDVATAVAASSAVPTYFAPVRIDGNDYVDGAVHSPTNADLLTREDLDLVVVSSPMSTAGGAAGLRSWSAAARRHFRFRLATEVRRLHRAGIPTLVLQPSADDLAAMGNAAMDEARRGRVVAQAHATTLRRLRQPHRADAVALLADADVQTGRAGTQVAWKP